MGAGGRHWELLVQKLRVSACAGGDAKRALQTQGAGARDSRRTAASTDSGELADEEAGSASDRTSKEAEWVEYELLHGKGDRLPVAAAEPAESPETTTTDLLLQAPENHNNDNGPSSFHQVKLTGAVTKEELGRSTWTFLHTLAAQFPQKPTKQQQKDAKELMAIISRLYPCETCAEHFKQLLKTRPPKTSSGMQLSEWMCQVHNIVNKRLGKPEFPFEEVDFRWGTFDCDGACSIRHR